MNDFWEALLGMSIKSPHIFGVKSLLHSSDVGAGSSKPQFYAPPRYTQEPEKRRQAAYAPTYQPQPQTPPTVPYSPPQAVQPTWGERTKATLANDQAKRGAAYAHSTGGNYVPSTGKQDSDYMRGISQGFMNPLK